MYTLIVVKYVKLAVIYGSRAFVW